MFLLQCKLFAGPDLICRAKEHEDVRLHTEESRNMEAADVYIYNFIFKRLCWGNRHTLNLTMTMMYSAPVERSRSSGVVCIARVDSNGFDETYVNQIFRLMGLKKTCLLTLMRNVSLVWHNSCLVIVTHTCVHSLSPPFSKNMGRTVRKCDLKRIHVNFFRFTLSKERPKSTHRNMHRHTFNLLLPLQGSGAHLWWVAIIMWVSALKAQG